MSISRRRIHVWFQLVDQGVPVTPVKCVDCIATVDNLCNAVKEEYRNSHLAGIAAWELKVFPSCGGVVAPAALALVAPLGDHGTSLDNLLIVVAPERAPASTVPREVWFQLVSTSTGCALAKAASVPLTDHSSIKVLQDALKVMYNDSHLKRIAASDLFVYLSREARVSLDDDSIIGLRGKTKDTALKVIVLREPEWIDIHVEESNTSDLAELRRYQRRGQLIRENCPEHCNEILDKIDENYCKGVTTLPFICVEASSGMGKSQLAFALDGRRPSFYWFATNDRDNSQKLYQNFTSISDAFRQCVMKDNPAKEDEYKVMDTYSLLYAEELWTYGFLRALLEYSGSEEHTI